MPSTMHAQRLSHTPPPPLTPNPFGSAVAHAQRPRRDNSVSLRDFPQPRALPETKCGMRATKPPTIAQQALLLVTAAGAKGTTRPCDDAPKRRCSRWARHSPHLAPTPRSRRAICLVMPLGRWPAIARRGATPLNAADFVFFLRRWWDILCRVWRNYAGNRNQQRGMRWNYGVVGGCLRRAADHPTAAWRQLGWLRSPRHPREKTGLKRLPSLFVLCHFLPSRI